jgi:hypothetical protein
MVSSERNSDNQNGQFSFFLAEKKHLFFSARKNDVTSNTSASHFVLVMFCITTLASNHRLDVPIFAIKISM